MLWSRLWPVEAWGSGRRPRRTYCPLPVQWSFPSETSSPAQEPAYTCGYPYPASIWSFPRVEMETHLGPAVQVHENFGLCRPCHRSGFNATHHGFGAWWPRWLRRAYLVQAAVVERPMPIGGGGALRRVSIGRRFSRMRLPIFPDVAQAFGFGGWWLGCLWFDAEAQQMLHQYFALIQRQVYRSGSTV